MTRGVIGRFTLAKDGGWAGEVRTLFLDAKLRLVPNDNRESENAPTFRVFVGQSHVGDAWEGRSSGEPSSAYLRVRLDDPSFPEPMQAALFVNSSGDQAQLVWSRRRHPPGE